ncbi:hypothetical protein WH367_16230 [Comamonas sp. MYb21]|uniref:hypothetical protein n=1 Tax=unclassified Comamonas TaxID=2638500 RepID=UPI00309550D2
MRILLKNSPRYRFASPLMRGLLAAGLLSASTAWAGTWNINYTPQQTPNSSFYTSPPSASSLTPVMAFSPPTGMKLGVYFSCNGGAFTPDPAAGVYQQVNNPSGGFIAFDNLGASPSAVAINVTPDTVGGVANCELEAFPTYYDVVTGDSAQVEDVPHAGYVSNAQGYDQSGDPSAPSYYAWVSEMLVFHSEPIISIPSIESGPISDSGSVTSNLFINSKTTTATVTFELTNAQATDSTITFMVTEVPQSYLGGSYDPVSEGYLPAYGNSTPITVTIPANQTSIVVTLPAILPGSQVIINPTTYPGAIDGTPVLDQLTPLVFRMMGNHGDPEPLVYVKGIPGSDPAAQVVPTNQISFSVKLNVPPPPNVSLSCLPSEILDSDNQSATCTISSDVAAGTAGLRVNLNLPQSNPRYSTDCPNPIIIASGATAASCKITATSNMVAGDGNVTAALSLAAPTNANEYVVTGSAAQVLVKDDDVVTPPDPSVTPQPVPTLGGWALGLLSALLFGFASIRRSAFGVRE